MPLDESAQPTRRQFYHLSAIYALWTAIAAMVSVPAFVYLFFPPKPKGADEWVDAADLTQLEPNVPQEVSFHRNRIDGWKVSSEKTTAWIVKTADDQAIAFAPQCTHLACAYHWDEQKKNFMCPCHGSSFGIDGRVLGGPAPRPLDRYAVKIDGSRLELGPIQRQA